MLQYIKKNARILALLCALTVFLLPSQSLAQRVSEARKETKMGVQMDAQMDAQRDAQRDANGSMWFILGCLLGPTPIVIAYVVDPSPPMSRLMGKSPEYVATYTDTYREEVKRIRTKNALWGFLLSAGGCTVLYIAYIGVIAATVFPLY